MIEKLNKYPENELSKKIIVPLLSKMYSKSKVEFTGGGIEKGRDIIVYNKDSFGFDEYIGIQVKKIKATPNSSVNSFQQLLNQLSQMKNEGVICGISGHRISLSKLMFITPYTISEKTYDSHKGALREVIKNGIHIIDGNKLSELINEYVPELVSQILGEKNYIGNAIQPALTNKTLLSALNFKKTKSLSEIYCKSSLVVGNNSKEYNNFKLKYIPKGSSLKVDLIKIGEINDDNTTITKVLEQCIFDIGDLDKYTRLLREHLEIKDNIEILREHGDSIVSKINDIIRESKHREMYPTIVKSKEFSDFMNKSIANIEIPTKFNEHDFFKEYYFIKEQYLARVATLDNIKKNNERDDKIPKEVLIKAYPKEVANRINSIISDFESSEHDLEFNMRDYLLRSLEISTTLDKISNYAEIISTERCESKNKAKSITFAIDKAFDTDLNILILGEAGSGKTTNLQIYAQKLYKNHIDSLTIYATLNELAKLTGDDKQLEVGIKKYLENLGINNITKESLKEHFRKSKTTLILDSIDEAIVEYPWIINAINEFFGENPKCQIITSSRFTVEQVSSLPFANISLLPFDDTQRQEFFEKWFNDNEKSSAITSHLNLHPELKKIVTNPLSATILATLQESNIPLPKTESSLYRKRFELVSGKFDNFKGVCRSDIEPDVLLSCARFIAFKMHVDNKRDITHSEALTIIRSKFEDEAYASLILKELKSPSEILLLNFNGSLGFGHLRFQEYLTSELLNDMRSIPIYKRIINPWWHDVFSLYSQHAQEIDWIVNDASNNAYTLKIAELLKKMIGNRPLNEARSLTSRLEIAIRDEKKYIK
ncbi:hypothetical protein MO387_08605 [Shewanella sp. N2AIL]|uniref:hypothetical protein n=1 Tax=Shewanella TaxID=22 RepID=UPI001F29B932|nr:MULTISPECIES: hypothetical protein [Shewanella]MCI2963147.1 hypothetical protein [Shewanella sp. N2AIL]